MQSDYDFPDFRRAAAPRGGRWLAAVAMGALALAVGVAVVAHLGDVERFVALAVGFNRRLLALAALLQLATYACVALVWWLTLRPGGHTPTFGSLMQLSVAKLFTEQAVPAGGVSGTTFLLAALRRRGLPPRLCADTVVTTLVSYYAAYLAMALVGLGLLAAHHAATKWLVTLTALFAVVAIAIPGGAAWVLRRGRRRVPRLLRRAAGITAWLRELRAAPGSGPIRPVLFAQTFAVQLGVFLLDAATLLVLLAALGEPVEVSTALPAFIVASMVATLGLVPLGLGTFEASCVAMLHTLGVSLEGAVSAALLLRGLTTWLPMLPGVWLVRRELAARRGKRQPVARQRQVRG